MKKIAVGLLAGFILAGSAFGDVVKKTKSEITFRKFGTLTTVQEEKLTVERRAADMESTFKGKGLVGSLAGKALLRSGKFGEIVDLPQSSVINIDHKKKRYEVRPIEPPAKPSGAEESRPGREEQAGESDVKIIRSEFKVEKTGETRTINQFNCRKYLITWVTDWENTKTGAKGTESLTTDVWTTELTPELAADRKVETAFFLGYMKKMGLDRDVAANDYLGLAWIEILGSLDPAGGKPRLSTSKAAAELKKIQGFPVVVDGKYFSKSEGGPAAEEEESSGGLLGRLSKKVLDRKPKDEGETPVLAYYTELMEIRTVDLAAEDFEPPAGYKEKK
ncbi:MAG: hypothetical protein JW747_00115 [Candidatus Aminicenantes bacterium]|nr:hypothetical protein [Candidatus Aminicenantes bacterium]